MDKRHAVIKVLGVGRHLELRVRLLSPWNESLELCEAAVLVHEDLDQAGTYGILSLPSAEMTRRKRRQQ